MIEKIRYYALLTRQDRPIGTVLLLCSNAWALLLAGEGQHSLPIILVFVVGTWLMRSAGCIMNDYADIEFDKHVKRTQSRPLTAGYVTKKEAFIVASLFVFVAFILVLVLDIKVVLMSVFGLVLAIIYPYMKRFTWWPQLFLGVAFSWGIPMVFVAYNGTVAIPGWAMFVQSIIWIVAYDTIYAMQDEEDDIKIGIKSTALRLGSYKIHFVILLQSLFLLGWLQAGLYHYAGTFFWLGIVGALLCFIYQWWLIILAKEDSFLKAFKNNQWVGILICFAILGF